MLETLVKTWDNKTLQNAVATEKDCVATLEHELRKNPENVEQLVNLLVVSNKKLTTLNNELASR